MEMIFKKLDKPSYLMVLILLFVFFNVLLNFCMPGDLALDLRFAYSSDEAYQAIKSMGQTVREEYLVAIWLLDFPYLLVYFLLLTGVLRKVWGNRKLWFLPLLIAVLDLLENISVSSLLITFPRESLVLGYFASFFTTTKWLSVGVCMIFLIAGLIRNYMLRNQSNMDLKV